MRPGLRPVGWALSAWFLSIPLAFGETGDHTVVSIDYEDLASEVSGRITFERPGTHPEPGHLVAGLLKTPGGQVGERFAGQTSGEARNRLGQRFDKVDGLPHAPLSVLPGDPGKTMSLAAHRGFKSIAAFALGPVGYPDRSALGEGALAVRFATPQEATGLRVHADYVDPLGVRPAIGEVRIRFYAINGALLADVRFTPEAGVDGRAWRFVETPAAGFLVTTRDPGGIAIDDILYAENSPTS